MTGESGAPAATAGNTCRCGSETAEAAKGHCKDARFANGLRRPRCDLHSAGANTGDFSLNTLADNSINKALEVAPADASARKLKASLHLTFHRFSDALALGEQLKSEFPKDAFIYGVLTDANAELGNYEAAVASAQSMVDLKPNSSSYARVAHMRSLYGDHKGALEMYTQAARTADPGDKEAQAWCIVQLGNENWKAGEYKIAIARYDESLDLLAGYYLAVAAKARTLVSTGELASAAALLEELNNRIPNVDSLILQGEILSKLGKQAESDNAFSLVETVEEKLGVAGDQKRLALFRADHDRNLPEALAIAEREYGIRKDVYTADVYAWCLFKNGRAKEALEISKQAMRLNTNESLFFYHAGMIEKELGNKAEAKKYLGQAVKANPDFDITQAPIAAAALNEVSK